MLTGFISRVLVTAVQSFIEPDKLSSTDGFGRISREFCLHEQTNKRTINRL